MKIVQTSFIHKFIHFAHEYHALKTHLTHEKMCQQMKYETMNEKMSRKFPHLPINQCVKCVFNAQYQRVKCTNHE